MRMAQLEIGEMMSINQVGDQTSDVRRAGEAIGFPFDLVCAEIENYGTDSAMGVIF